MPTTRASRPGPRRARPSCSATAVPSRTGETEAASVVGLVADHQTAPTPGALGAPWEAREVWLALLDIGVPPLLRLLGHVVEEGRVTGQLLDAGQPVVGRVHARLDHPQRQRALLQHLAAPVERLLLEPFERHYPVDEPHVQRLLGVVLVAKEPDLARLLLADDPGQ